MDCPKCGTATGVVDSRLRENNIIFRRRKCSRCLHRFSTREIPVDYIVPVIPGEAIRDALAVAATSIVEACSQPGGVVKLDLADRPRGQS